MTYLITQSVLNRITHAVLRLILSQIYNELAKSRQINQPCALAPDDPEKIKEDLRRRKQGPKPFLSTKRRAVIRRVFHFSRIICDGLLCLLSTTPAHAIKSQVVALHLESARHKRFQFLQAAFEFINLVTAIAFKMVVMVFA